MKDFHEQTYYELLDIKVSASQEDILKAYNRARATYGHNSPALYSLFNKEEAQELLKLIDEAYSVLSNQFKRRQYDSKAHISPPPSGAAVLELHEKVQKSATPPEDLAIPSAAALPGFNETMKLHGETTKEPGVNKSRHPEKEKATSATTKKQESAPVAQAPKPIVETKPM